MTYPPHRPADQKEKIRIYNKRGEIRESPIDGRTKIYMRARMYPSLLNSRSLGDLLGHQIGVISEPSIKTHEILSHDKFFIMGTSSVWEILAPEQVIDSITELGAKDKGVYSETVFTSMQESAMA
jgi:serine/threonine protein phosphatase PrpC